MAGNLVINAKSLENSAITASLDQTEYTYDGTEKEPAVTVKDGTKTLVLGTDYKVTYTNNINAGTATVTIEGMSNYSGTKELTFTIKKVKLTVTASSDVKAYDGTKAATGTASVPEVVSGEQPTLKDQVTFRFDKKDAGTNKMVYVEGLELDDTWKTNYELNSSTITLKMEKLQK